MNLDVPIHQISIEHKNTTELSSYREQRTNVLDLN